MQIEYAEWLDNQTFVCNFGQRIDKDGEWFELVGEYQKNKELFVFKRVYDDCVLPIRRLTTQLMMRAAMIATMREGDKTVF